MNKANYLKYKKTLGSNILFKLLFLTKYRKFVKCSRISNNFYNIFSEYQLLDMSKEIKYRIINRPILFIANSSWYLNHYRKELIRTISASDKHIIVVSPIDSSTESISKYSVHIPWRIYRSTGFNPFTFLTSLIKMFVLVRVIKPSFMHSHTLKANLITSFVSSFYGIPIVYSFAGMGRLYKSNIIKKSLFLYILKFISIFSSIERLSNFRWIYNPNRSYYIFQNPRDLRLFKNLNTSHNNHNLNFIPGSGLPERYIQNVNNKINNSWISNEKIDLDISMLDFIYCGRLLVSKGIDDFVEFAKSNRNSKFYIYGNIDKYENQSFLKKGSINFNQISSNINYLGNLPDPLLNHSTSTFPVLMLLSNYGEGLPRTILEAAALNIPVVSTKYAASEIFDERFIYITDSNQSHHINQTLSRVLSDYKIGKLTKKLFDARENVISNFMETNIVENTMEIYKKIELNKKNSILNSRDFNLHEDWLSD